METASVGYLGQAPTPRIGSDDAADPRTCHGTSPTPEGSYTRPSRGARTWTGHRSAGALSTLGDALQSLRGGGGSIGIAGRDTVTQPVDVLVGDQRDRQRRVVAARRRRRGQDHA